MAKKILVIDDEENFAKYLATFLKDSGYMTFCAFNADDAMKILTEQKPDLVTLDLQMPNETGSRFYRKMTKKKEYKDIPVIVVSGLPGRHLAVPKPYAIFDKPVDREELLKTVKEAIGEG